MLEWVQPFSKYIYIQYKGGKVDFSPFHSGVYVHPPQTYSPRLLIDFKNSWKWLSYFCILLCITTHLLLFLSPDWLIFCHVIISLIYIHSNIYLFSVSLWRRANVRNIRLYYPYWSYWQYTNLFIYFEKDKRLIGQRWLVHAAYSIINVVYCEGSVEIQIEISKVGELSLTKDLCSKR